MLSTWEPPLNNKSTPQICLVSIVQFLGDIKAATYEEGHALNYNIHCICTTYTNFYCDSGPYDLIMIYDDILDRFISSPVSHAYLPLCVLELFNTDFRYCNLWLGWSNIDRLVESEIANMKGKLFIKIYCTMQWLENIVRDKLILIIDIF